eukprot:TRINITY_DN7269_c0_g1_i1.p1 TRINITY_DN7269_c0_g1~~TRINITY_DN7269_c0_g1_i1.p1  ORF type:complete len:353 (-),score=77.25 TRINITY_DN7269_c0_g1_i1:3-971(-)
MSPLFGNNHEAKLEVAKQIRDSLTDSGFFLLSGHGIKILKEFFDITRDFHQRITDEERMKLAIVAYNKDNVKQVRNGYYLPVPGKKAVESFCYLNPAMTADHPIIKKEIPLHEVNVWPDPQKYPGFKEFQEDFYWKMFEMSAVLLKGFALALGLEENFFDTYYKKEDTMSSVRLIRYPYMENYPPIKRAPDGTKLSFDWHEDISFVTILYQPHISNLQVASTIEVPPSGFKNIPASDDCFLVNCGGYMGHITNNYFFAPLHRVKWVNAERLSLPYFLYLAHDSCIEPFTPFDPNSKPLKPAMTFGEYFNQARLDLIVKNGQT